MSSIKRSASRSYNRPTAIIGRTDLECQKDLSQSHQVCSGQQFLDFVPAQRGGKLLLAADGRLDDLALAVLQCQDLLLHRVARDELVARHDLRLPDAMC